MHSRHPSIEGVTENVVSFTVLGELRNCVDAPNLLLRSSPRQVDGSSGCAAYPTD